jgi:hypothetical protein
MRGLEKLAKSWWPVAFLAVALVAAASLVLVLPSLATPDAASVLAVALAVALALGALALRRDDVQGVLLATAQWLPGILAVSIVALLLLDAQPLAAVASALIISGVVWLATGFALRRWASVDRGQPRSYAELVDRFARLEADIEVLTGKEQDLKDMEGDLGVMSRIAARQLIDYRASLAAELGGGKPDRTVEARRPGREYVTGSAYIDLWNRIHRAEEAVIILAPRASVLASANYDLLRLDGSKMKDQEKLEKQLNEGIKELKDAKPHSDDEARARGELRGVRLSINRYRDEQWDKMVSEKRQLLRTMLLTGLTAVAALILAVLAGVERPVIVGAAAFYLVGAIVGLFARLRSEAEGSSAVDDYGLAAARLQVTPLISGLAGIAGVVLMAKVILPVSDVVAPATIDDSGKVTNIATEVRTPASLHDTFDIDLNPSGLLLAAVFGLTPGLVLDRLKSQADQIKGNIQSSGVTASKTTTDDTDAKK